MPPLAGIGESCLEVYELRRAIPAPPCWKRINRRAGPTTCQLSDMRWPGCKGDASFPHPCCSLPYEVVGRAALGSLEWVTGTCPLLPGALRKAIPAPLLYNKVGLALIKRVLGSHPSQRTREGESWSGHSAAVRWLGCEGSAPAPRFPLTTCCSSGELALGSEEQVSCASPS